MRGRGFSQSGHRGIALLTAFIVLCLGAGHIGLNRAKTANACPTQTYYTLTVTVEPAGGARCPAIHPCPSTARARRLNLKLSPPVAGASTTGKARATRSIKARTILTSSR